jgi:protein SCO1
VSSVVRRSRRPALPALLLSAGLALAACSGPASAEGEEGHAHGDAPATVEAPEDDYAGVDLAQPYHRPSFTLTDTTGAEFDFRTATGGRPTLLFFGYTNCPDICQVVMQTLASAMTRLEKADREQVDVVFVTTDPARDDQAALRAYLDRFDPAFIGLTGPLPRIVEIGKDLAVAVEHGEKLPSGGYDVTHGTSVLGIDSDDEVPIVWTHGTSATQYAADVHQLLDG